MSGLSFHLRLEDDARRVLLMRIAAGLVIGIAFLGCIFLSPTLVLGATVGALAIIVTFARPAVTLGFLTLYLPFEPFILKWAPDELYVFARYGSELLIYLIALAVLVRLLLGDAKYPRTPIDVPVAFFGLSLLASVIINFVPPLQAALGIRQIIRFIILFFAVVILKPSHAWVRRVLMGLLIIAGIQAALGYGQAVVGESFDRFLLPSERKTFGEWQLTGGTQQFWDPGERVFGTMGRYDQLGTFLALTLIMLMAFLYERVFPKDKRPTIWLAVLALLPALALTYSRSSWFGFVLGFLAMALLFKRDRRVLILSIAIPAVLGAYLLVSGLVVDRIVEGYGRQTFAERFFESFSYERWRGEYDGLGRVYWAVQTFTTVIPHAPVFGFGPGRFGGGAVAALHDTSVYDGLGLPFGVYGTGGYVDNNWLSIWGETGTLGMAFYLWMYLSLFILALDVARRSKNKETRALALALGGSLVAVALNASLATMLEVRTLAPYLWILAGVVVVRAQEEKLIDEVK